MHTKGESSSTGHGPSVISQTSGELEWVRDELVSHERGPGARAIKSLALGNRLQPRWGVVGHRRSARGAQCGTFCGAVHPLLNKQRGVHTETAQHEKLNEHRTTAQGKQNGWPHGPGQTLSMRSVQHMVHTSTS